MRINRSITKTAMTVLIVLLLLLNISAQDTLIYKYMNPLDGQTPESRMVAHYYLNDSVFIIEGLFDIFPANSPYRFHYKIDNLGQWFMKYKEDWKLFFNGKDGEQVGSWYKRFDKDIGILWEKTRSTDGSDTIYTFHEKSFYDSKNPKIDTLSCGLIRHTSDDFVEYLSTFYFTGSSGIIAFDGLYGIWIREDKKYLKSRLDSYLK